MNRLGLSALCGILDISFRLGKGKKCIGAQEASAGGFCNKKSLPDGWQYNSLYSPYTRVSHHFFYLPSSKRNAPVLLLLHGLLFDARNFLPLSSLHDRFNLIAYDFPVKTSLYRGDLNDFRYLLDDFLDVLGIDSVNLCGVSFGGAVAMRFTAAHPRRVKALILASTFIMNSNPRDRLMSKVLARTILKHPDERIQWAVQTALSFAMKGKNNPLRAIESMLQVKPANWYRQVVSAITTCEGPEDACQIRCPVIALHGTKDKTVSFKTACSIKDFIPHAQFETITHGTHAMTYLQGELIASKIRSFYESQEGSLDRDKVGS